ncbi:MAG: SAM-dependent methyltransferase [Archangium sp.]
MLGNVEALLLIVTLAGASIVWSTLRLGISPMPTSPRVLKSVLSVIPSELSGDVVELGAGWGTLAWAVAKARPSCRVIAWEASPVPFAFCWLRSKVQRRTNLMLRFGDFRDADLASSSLVLAYLWTGAMTQLAPRFDAELKPGTVVVTHTFAWRGREPDLTVYADDVYRTPVYRYLQ